MFIHCGLFLIFLGSVRTTEFLYDYGLENTVTEYEQRFSYWPSVHNALLRVQKRDVSLGEDKILQSENGAGIVSDVAQSAKEPSQAVTAKDAVSKEIIKPDQPYPSKEPSNVQQPSQTSNIDKTEEIKSPVSNHLNETADNSAKAGNESSVNSTSVQSQPKSLNLNDPGVLTRAVIVFGGFLLLAVAYYIFYRKKNNKSDVNNTHSTNDANQFRYGVLQSDDRRDNMELSRVPLTMESDDDDDEDLEIFDLEQKKKSLSYVNLQTSDEDVVFHNSTIDGRGTGKDTLLLDIEDATSETLINWSGNSSKSIL